MKNTKINFNEVFEKIKEKEMERLEQLVDAIESAGLDINAGTISFNEFNKNVKRSSGRVKKYKLKFNFKGSIEKGLVNAGYLAETEYSHMEATDKALEEYVKAMLYIWEQLEPKINKKKHLIARDLDVFMPKLVFPTDCKEFNDYCFSRIDNIFLFVLHFIPNKLLDEGLFNAELYSWSL